MQSGSPISARDGVFGIDGVGDSGFEFFNRGTLGDPVGFENFDDSVDVVLVYGLPAVRYHWELVYVTIKKMAMRQLRAWRGKFGREYTDRNAQTLTQLDKMFADEYGVSAKQMFGAAFKGLSIRNVLEVGCNIGNKLALLYELGLKDLTGVEPQNGAIKLGEKRYPFIKFHQGTIFKLPFDDDSFDLVFTSGVLIHIHPADLSRAMKEIVRVSRRWILGFEYYSAEPKRVNYRGRDELLWKRNFMGEYFGAVPGLKILYEKRFKHNLKVAGRKGLKSQIFVLQK